MSSYLIFDLNGLELLGNAKVALHFSLMLTLKTKSSSIICLSFTYLVREVSMFMLLYYCSIVLLQLYYWIDLEKGCERR